MEVNEEVIIPKSRSTVSELSNFPLVNDVEPSVREASEHLQPLEFDQNVDNHEDATDKNYENKAVINGSVIKENGPSVNDAETSEPQIVERPEDPFRKQFNAKTASKVSEKSDPEIVTKNIVSKCHNNNVTETKGAQETNKDAMLKMKPRNESTAKAVGANSKLVQNEKCEITDEKLAIQEIEEKCHSLQDENESLRNQLEERERFLEDILNEIEEFKEKSKQNHNDLRVENIKLKEVNRSQMNKFSIERDFMLKENEFLKQRIEYLNEDVKFYSDRQEKETNSKESFPESNCCFCKSQNSETWTNEKSSGKFLEDQPTGESELRAKISSLQIEIDASITLISSLEKDLESKNNLVSDVNLKLEKSLETEKGIQLTKQELEKDIKMLLEDKKDLQLELTNLRVSNQALAGKEDALREMTQKLKEFKQLEEDRSAKMLQLSEQFCSINEKCSSLEKQNTELKEKCKNLELENEEFLSQTQTIDDSTQTEKSSFLVAKEASVQTLEDILLLETSIKDLNFEREKLKRCYDEQLNTIQQLQTEIISYKDNYGNLFALKNSVEQKMEEQILIIRENESTIKGLNELLNRKSSELMKSTVDFQNLQSSWDEQLIQIENEQKEKELLDRAVKNLQSELSNLFTDKQKVAHEFEKAKDLVKSLENELSKERDLNAQNGKLVEELRLNSENDSLQNQVNQMKDEIEGFQNEILRKNSIIEHMELDLKNLSEKVEIQERETSELLTKHQNDIAWWKSQIEEAKNDIEKYEIEKLEKDSAIEQFEKSLQDLSVKMQQLEKEKEEVANKYEEDILLWKKEVEQTRKSFEDFENEKLAKNCMIEQLENDVKNHSAKIEHLELEKAELSSKFEQDNLWWKTECEQNISQRCEIEAKLSNISEDYEQKLSNQLADHGENLKEISRKYDEEISELAKSYEKIRSEKNTLEKNLEETCQQYEQKLNDELNKLQTELKESHEKEIEELKKFSGNREQLIKELEIKVSFLRETLESKEVNVTTADIGTDTLLFDDEISAFENTQIKLLESGLFGSYSRLEDFTNISTQNSTQTEMIPISKKAETESDYPNLDEKKFNMKAVQSVNNELFEEIENLRSQNTNLEVELTTTKAQFDLEMDEVKQALFDSQQECARYQATMVQMKTHYEQTIKLMRSDQAAMRKETQTAVRETKSETQLSRQHIKTIEELKNVKDENSKLRRKLETKVEVLDEINDKISTIASTLSIQRPFTPRRYSKMGLGRQMFRSTGPSMNSNDIEANDANATPRFTSPFRLSGRTTSEDTGFSSPDMSSAETWHQIDNIKAVLQHLQSSLEGLRESSTTDSGCQGNDSNSNSSRLHQRHMSPHKSGRSSSQGPSLQSTNTSNLNLSESPNQQMVELLTKQEKEIDNLRKQLDDRDEYIAHRAYATSTISKSPTRDSRTFDNVVEENRLLRSQLDNALSMSSRNEARSNKLAKQLEDKYRNDLVTLEELQSKVVSVTNFKQNEITELEITLKKTLKENKFLKEELKYIRDKKLEERRHLSSASLDLNSGPDIDTNPIAFSAQLRNLYNTSPI